MEPFHHAFQQDHTIYDYMEISDGSLMQWYSQKEVIQVCTLLGHLCLSNAFSSNEMRLAACYMYLHLLKTSAASGNEKSSDEHFFGPPFLHADTFLKFNGNVRSSVSALCSCWIMAGYIIPFSGAISPSLQLPLPPIWNRKQLPPKHPIVQGGEPVYYSYRTSFHNPWPLTGCDWWKLESKKKQRTAVALGIAP